MNGPSFIPSITSALKYLASTSYLKSILKIIFNNLNQFTKIVNDNWIKKGSTWAQISRFVHLYSVGVGFILMDFYCLKSTSISTFVFYTVYREFLGTNYCLKTYSQAFNN